MGSVHLSGNLHLQVSQPKKKHSAPSDTSKITTGSAISFTGTQNEGVPNLVQVQELPEKHFGPQLTQSQCEPEMSGNKLLHYASLC